MTSLSQSDTVVDDFLSSLSQLSQDRLREDQQRQRDLQRNIDVLKLRLNSTSPVKRVGKSDLTSFSASLSESGISLLKFNRNLSYRNEINGATVVDEVNEDVGDIEEDSGPELPKRRYLTEEARNSPILPARRDVLGKKIPPSKPVKNLLQLKSDFDVDLLQPTSRKSDNIPTKEVLVQKDYNKPTSVSVNSGKGKSKSFLDIENDIKSSSIPNTFDSRVESLIAKAGSKHSDDSKSYNLPGRPSKNSKSNTSPENNDGNSLKPKPKPQWLTSSNSPSANNNVYAISKSSNIPSANKPSPSNSSSMCKPTPKPKSDWLSSALSTNKLSWTPKDSTRNFVIPKKGEYSNNGANREIDDNSGGQNRSFSSSPTKQTDWMTSLYKNSTTTTTKLPPTISKPAYLSEVKVSANSFNNDGSSQDTSTKPKKPTSWIDSALKKSDSVNKFDALKPSYQMPIKSKSPIIEETVEEPEPELFAKFKDRSLSPQKPPIIPPKLPNKVQSKEEPTAEYLTKLKAITNKDSKKPIKPSKPPIDQYVKEEQDLLSQTKLKLGAKPQVPKLSKPSLDKYTIEDESVLKSTMRLLSPNKTTKQSTTYLEKDAEELRNQMTRLSTSPSKFSQPNVKRYESQDTEELKSQLNKLGSKKSTYNKIDKPQEEIEGLAALTKLKPTKPAKPMANKDQLEESIKLKPTIPAKPTKSTLVDKDIEESIKLTPAKPEVDFKSQLSSILKVGSGPLTPRYSDNDLGMKNITYSQSTKDSKLTHHTKSRAKGPKRRLPKKGKDSTPSTSTSTPTPTPTPTATPSKKPYINKSNKPKPEIKVKPRIFSGEVFI